MPDFCCRKEQLPYVQEITQAGCFLLTTAFDILISNIVGERDHAIAIIAK